MKNTIKFGDYVTYKQSTEHFGLSMFVVETTDNEAKVAYLDKGLKLKYEWLHKSLLMIIQRFKNTNNFIL